MCVKLENNEGSNGPSSFQKFDKSDAVPWGEVHMASAGRSASGLGWDWSPLLLDEVAGFLPARLAAKYSHVKPRFSQRWHVGFLPEHFTLDDAQKSQLLRSWDPSGAVRLPFLGVEGVGEVDRRGFCTTAMLSGSKIYRSMSSFERVFNSGFVNPQDSSSLGRAQSILLCKSSRAPRLSSGMGMVLRRPGLDRLLESAGKAMQQQAYPAIIMKPEPPICIPRQGAWVLHCASKQRDVVRIYLSWHCWAV